MFSIIIPGFNEEDVLEENVSRIYGAAKSIGDFELIIVEESTDSTPAIAAKLAVEYPGIRHIHSDVRLGKGGGIERGVEMARGDKIVFMDVDLSTDLTALPLLVSALDSFDVAVGSRFHKDSRVKRPAYRVFLSFCLARIVGTILGIPVSDTQCGFKGFRKKAIKEAIPYVEEKGWFWDVELLYYLKRLGYSITTVPVTWEEKRKASYAIPANILYHLKNIVRFYFTRKK
ncbi:MAG: glycosyltransferase [Candidatus Altiarchaeota archaeon]